MSAAFRSHGRGTPILRMRFRGVGQIERATGFADEAMLLRLKEMCRTLHEYDRDDILRDIQAGRVTLRDVWALYRRGEWDRIPTAQHAVTFGASFRRWYTQKPTASYQVFAEKLLRALGGDFPLGELRARLATYRQQCEQARHGALWNRTQSRLMAYLRDTVGREHILYRDVARFDGLPEVRTRAVHPQTPSEAATLREILGGEHGRIWWVMCCHGFMPDEFFGGKWRVEDGRLRILGTKTAQKTTARDRTVPLLAEPFTPKLAQTGFSSYLRYRALGITAYDARRSYGLWCDLAGFPEAWKRALMGHAQNVTGLYGWRESERIANEVESALRKLVGLEGGQAPASAPSAPHVHG